MSFRGVGPAPILVTGSSGLIGRYVCERLETNGHCVRRFDLQRHPGQDIRNPVAIAEAMRDVQGVVHLAAVSRVAWAEQAPALCQESNVEALKYVLEACHGTVRKWCIFASSREVYGNQEQMPVREDAELNPINVYGRSKLAAEQLVLTAQQAGVAASICRFTSVYGCVEDHADRVVPAFARAAANGAPIKILGSSQFYDFVHVSDAVEGLIRLIELTADGMRPVATVHLASGIGTNLGLLAKYAGARSLLSPEIVEEGAKCFHVNGFIGDTDKAKQLLGWRATIGIEGGLSRLIQEFQSRAQSRHAGSESSFQIGTP